MRNLSGMVLAVALASLGAWSSDSSAWAAPVQGGCADFEHGTPSDPYSGFVGVNVILNVLAGGPSGDHYLRTQDDSGESYELAPSWALGDYRGLGPGSAFCYDVRLFEDGNPSGHDLDPPWLWIGNDSATATFDFNTGISEDGGSNPGWHHVCVPVGGTTPPTTPDGSWRVLTGDWPTLMANVTQVKLSAFDFTSSPSEEAGYDNVCLITTPSAAPAQGGCTNFQHGTSSDPYSGFAGVGTTLSVADGGPSGVPGDLYLRTQDQPGESYVVAPAFTQGSYSGLAAASALCFDVRLFNDGNPAGHDLDPPWLLLMSGTTSAAFNFSAGISEDGGSNPGWHHICAPLGGGGSTPPTSPNGVWTVNSGTWSSILANVTQIKLSAFDFTSSTEEAGYDNFCLATIETGCVGFEGGTTGDPFSGFVGRGVDLSIQTPGPSGGASNSYLRTIDQPGESFVDVPTKFVGNYSGLSTGAAICFDVRLFEDGNPVGHDLDPPWLLLMSGTASAAFNFYAGISEDGGSSPGWHHVCAPLGGGSSPPTSASGVWTVNGGTWASILSNVTEVKLSGFDFTSATEQAGYDNFCIGATQEQNPAIPVPALTPVGLVVLAIVLPMAGYAVLRRRQKREAVDRVS
jgi:hypothetical protein